MRSFVTLLLIGLAISSFCQQDFNFNKAQINISDNKGSGGDTIIPLKLENEATPIGGVEKFTKNISDYCSLNYPLKDKKKGTQGQTFVEFVVEKDGSLTNLKIKDGYSLSKPLDKVAIKAVQTSAERWNPGTLAGRPVRQIMTIPIKFNLENK